MTEVTPADDAILTDEELAEIAKSVAPHQVEFLKHLRTMTLDQALNMSNWLVASLLAINSGATFAIVSAADRISNPSQPGAFFVAGIMLALLSGYLIQFFGLKLVGPISELMGYWLSVEEDGWQSAKLEAQHTAAMKRLQRWALSAPICGWLSAGLFLAGAITASHSWVGAQQPGLPSNVAAISPPTQN